MPSSQPTRPFRIRRPFAESPATTSPWLTWANWPATTQSNAASKDDQDALMAAITATQMTFEDILDSVWPFEKADAAIDYIWQGKQVGRQGDVHWGQSPCP